MRRTAFTLVEILIVVVILGILSAIVVPQFASATSSAQEVATLEQLGRLRRALSVYYVRNNGTYPAVTAGTGTWGQLISPDYLRAPGPENNWVAPAAARIIVLRASPDTAFHSDYGWIFDPLTGNAWAAGFDGEDRPLPRP
jgi:prepilin-type N-terminal cleavage/methylation domain-containing protein